MGIRVGLLCTCALALGTLPARAQQFVYAANEGSNTVSGYSVSATGALTPVPGSPFAAGPYPVFVTVDPLGRFAYVANYACQFGVGCGSTPSSVSAYTVNPSTGALTPVLGSPFATGVGSYQVTVAPSGRFAYVTNFYSNDISAFSIDARSGALTPVPGSPFASGGVSPNSVVVDPSGQFAYVQNFYSDATVQPNTSNVSAFRIGAAGGLTFIAGSPFALGTGSGSSMAVTSCCLYAANTYASTVTGYSIDPATGALSPLAGSPFPDVQPPTSVTLDPGGHFAYVPNGATNTVSVYSIDGQGNLTPVAGSPFASAGTYPYEVAVAPTAQVIYVADYDSGDVSAFSVNASSGALTLVAGSPFAAGSFPSSVVAFSPVLSIADTFENPTLNPAWQIVSLLNETVALSTAQNHTPNGHQSLSITTTTSGQRNAYLQRSLGSSTPGTGTVYFYDSGPGFYAGFELIDSATGMYADIGTQDFDPSCYRAFIYLSSTAVFGPNATCGPSPFLETTSVPRSVGWHKFTIASTDQVVTLSIDGQPAFDYEGALTFDTAQLFVVGPNQSNVTYYFDDFSFVSGNVNMPPVANAGPNQTVRPLTTVYFNGTGSFDDNTPTNLLVYAWSFVSVPVGSAAMLTGASTATPNFTPDVAGSYVVQLVVTDQGGLQSAPSLVIIGENPPPVANAGPDQLVIVNQLVTLNGSGADADGDLLSYAWTLTTKPVGSAAELTSPTMPGPAFIPDLQGLYVAQLVVSDFLGGGAPSTVQITATTAAGFAEAQIQSAGTALTTLPTTAVTTEGNRHAFTAFLGNATLAIQNGSLTAARQQLQQALSRTDGCALRGLPDGNGPSRDWITTCAAQSQIYPLLVAALAALSR